MRVLAIDPGYDRIGVAVIEKLPRSTERLVHSTCIETNRHDSFEARLKVMGAELERIITAHAPQRAAIEKLYFETNKKTAMLVAEARGVIRYILAHHNLPIHEYTPLEIKVAVVGDGRATKTQIMRMLPKLIAIEKDIKRDDEFDAVAIGLTCIASTRK